MQQDQAKGNQPSLASRVGNHLKSRLSLKTIGKEMAATITDRIIPHGGAELAHALMTQGSGYVPYGQEAIPVADADPAELGNPPSPQLPPSMLDTYRANVAASAQSAQTEAPDQSQAPGI